MREHDLELFDDDIDDIDDSLFVTTTELGIPIDLARDDLDDPIVDDDGLGFRALYVNPERVLGDADAAED